MFVRHIVAPVIGTWLTEENSLNWLQPPTLGKTIAETDVQGIPEQSPPQFELEHADDYSQYLLHSKSEILSVLRSLVQKGAMVTAYFDRGNSFLLTSLTVSYTHLDVYKRQMYLLKFA